MTDPSSRFPSPYHLPPMHELTKQKKKTDDEGLLTLYALSRVLAEKLATPTIITTTTDAAETDEKKKNADASSSAPAAPPHTPSRQQKLLSSLLHVEESAMPSEVEQAAKMYLLEMQKQKLPPSQLKFEWGKTCDPEDHTGSASVLAAVATHRTCSALMQLQLLGTDETNDDDTGASTVDPAAAVAARRSYHAEFVTATRMLGYAAGISKSPESRRLWLSLGTFVAAHAQALAARAATDRKYIQRTTASAAAGAANLFGDAANRWRALNGGSSTPLTRAWLAHLSLLEHVHRTHALGAAAASAASRDDVGPSVRLAEDALAASEASKVAAKQLTKAVGQLGQGSRSWFDLSWLVVTSGGESEKVQSSSSSPSVVELGEAATRYVESLHNIVERRHYKSKRANNIVYFQRVPSKVIPPKPHVVVPLPVSDSAPPVSGEGGVLIPAIGALLSFSGEAAGGGGGGEGGGVVSTSFPEEEEGGEDEGKKKLQQQKQNSSPSCGGACGVCKCLCRCLCWPIMCCCPCVRICCPCL